MSHFPQRGVSNTQDPLWLCHCYEVLAVTNAYSTVLLEMLFICTLQIITMLDMVGRIILFF